MLTDGLLLLELKDAIRQGDGERILHCWRTLFLHFYASNHTNYAREAVRLQASVKAMATQCIAAQLDLESCFQLLRERRW